VFQLGLLEVKAHVVDALPYAGGQCVELYPDKPIYDIPAVPYTTGRELTQSLLKQIAPFGTQFHFGQQVSTLQRQADQRFLLETTKGTRLLTKTVFIAAGVGAFVPRALKLDGIEALEGTQVFYRPDPAIHYADKNVVLLGGDEASLSWAVRLCEDHDQGTQGTTQSITLIHRRDVFQAPPALLQRVQALRQSGQLQFVAGQIMALDQTAGQLTALQVLQPDTATLTLPADMLLANLGLSPKLGPVAEWGLDMDRKQLTVNTETFATNEPGIFAVGDINTYPGKKKLIVCGFHECVLAAFGAMPLIAPDKKVMLQYTTTSTKLHQLLGVAPAGPQ
jgi:thioredoxin reductase (NADPH)